MHKPLTLYCVWRTCQVSEEELRKNFEVFGEVTGVKLCHKGGYGFVAFREHACAVQAIVAMNGQELKGKVQLGCTQHPDLSLSSFHLLCRRCAWHLCAHRVWDPERRNGCFWLRDNCSASWYRRACPHPAWGLHGRPSGAPGAFTRPPSQARLRPDWPR